jgi:hypothetical protein
MSEVKERPILMQSDMVCATLRDRKTQTRRVIKPQPELTDHSGFLWKGFLYGQGSTIENTYRNFSQLNCQHGRVGDHLWVREQHFYSDIGSNMVEVVYLADNKKIWQPVTNAQDAAIKRMLAIRPSIHMPRWASRIDLEIVNIRVERLNDISEADALAEGIELHGTTRFDGECKLAFKQLWQSINGPGSWDQNPWVWVIEFKRVKPS